MNTRIRQIQSLELLFIDLFMNEILKLCNFILALTTNKKVKYTKNAPFFVLITESNEFSLHINREIPTLKINNNSIGTKLSMDKRDFRTTLATKM